MGIFREDLNRKEPWGESYLSERGRSTVYTILRNFEPIFKDDAD